MNDEVKKILFRINVKLLTLNLKLAFPFRLAVFQSKKIHQCY